MLRGLANRTEPIEAAGLMKTQMITETSTDKPRLEHYPTAGGTAEQTLLDDFPFTIGRSETADLPIDSSRVSRQHVSILREGDDFRVRDLGSTNGTFLNGQRIDEEALVDGDLLVIADLEFTFCSGLPVAPRDTATMVMDTASTEVPDEELAKSLLRAIRRLQEKLTWRCIETLFQPIIHLEGDRIFGYEAVGESDGRHLNLSDGDRLLLATECRLTGRLRRLERLVAVEQAARLPADAYIFVRVDSSEMGAGRLVQSLAQLRDTLAASQRLVIELPEAAMSNTPHCREFRQRLRELDVAVAYDGSVARDERLFARAETRPDFLKLSQSLVRGMSRGEKAQQQVQSLIRVGSEAGCAVIAMGVETEDEVEMFRQLGCRFGQGDYFGPPQPVDSLQEGTPEVDCDEVDCDEVEELVEPSV